ncbi:MAG: hypothetical protein PHV85_05910 [Desulfovibrionaceae bacterium]|nr:hypothetical protein [Desulfovibrionaceae bacterium]
MNLREKVDRAEQALVRAHREGQGPKLGPEWVAQTMARVRSEEPAEQGFGRLLRPCAVVAAGMALAVGVLTVALFLSGPDAALLALDRAASLSGQSVLF